MRRPANNPYARAARPRIANSRRASGILDGVAAALPPCRSEFASIAVLRLLPQCPVGNAEVRWLLYDCYCAGLPILMFECFFACAINSRTLSLPS